jgi:hypothetical protein
VDELVGLGGPPAFEVLEPGDGGGVDAGFVSDAVGAGACLVAGFVGDGHEVG